MLVQNECILCFFSMTSVLLAALSVGSITLGMTGCLSLWGTDLDPITLITLVMSLGLSVDFTAHISYHYSSRQRPDSEPSEQLYEALKAVAWPTIQAGLSTALCASVLSIVNSYMFIPFVKTIALVVFWGILHAFVIQPVILTNLSNVL